VSEPRHKGKCGITGPYYEVGDVDWECRFHGVMAELRDPSRWGALNLRREDFYCPVGQPHLAPGRERYTDEDRLAAQRGQLTNPLPDPPRTLFVTEPTEEWPEGSECPVHHRVHSSHGWYVCLPSNGLTEDEREAARRWFAGDESAWPEVAASIERTVARLAREWPECPEHKEVQHRDRKPPWCNTCGWNRGRPAIGARKVGTPRSERKDKSRG